MHLKKTIIFSLNYEHEWYPVHVSNGEYESLMDLISHHLNILGFGLCCGAARCGTCMVTICVQNERRSAMSCGVYIDDEMANTEIIISEAHQRKSKYEFVID